MKIIILYRKNSEANRPVQDFIGLLYRKYPGKQVTEIDLDTKKGAEMAQLHQIVDYPGIIVRSDSGQVLGTWQGLPLPLVDEVVSLLIA